MRLITSPSCLLLISVPLVLTGCALNTTATPVASQGLAIQGMVRGGQSPINGAHVYLFAANIGANAGPGIAASSSNLSTSLLTGATTGFSDSVGAYVKSGSDGSFSITGDYLCTSGQLVYLYSLGGDPGGGSNSAAGLLSALGTCPNSGSFLISNPHVQVDEATTIAAAYALAGYATDATHISSANTPLALAGIANAFANAANIASNVTGQALATTPAGNGTVPQPTVDTLANLLATCVNSTGPGSTPCSTLLGDALSAGSSGTAPSDTASAAINIAHNPGNAVSALFALQTAEATPFLPDLGVAPNDFTIALQFAGGGMNHPNGIAIDASGNAWITNYAGNSLTELSSTGAPSAGSPYTGGGIAGTIGIAIDPTGNIWVVDDTNIHAGNTGAVTKLSSTGSILSGASGYTGSGLDGAYSIAIDGSGDAWVPNSNGTSGAVTELSGSGVPSSGSPYSGGGFDYPGAVAIDASGNVWLANHTAITELSHAGAVLSGANGYTGGGLSGGTNALAIDHGGNAWVAALTNVTKLSSSGSNLSGGSGISLGTSLIPYSIAVDGSNNVWTANYIGTSLNTIAAVSISELSNSGSVISGTNGFGYTSATVAEQNGGGVVIDGSGDVWLAVNGTGTSVTEFIGAATPAVTPLATAVADNALGIRP